MPKQILKIDKFHGGLNSNADPRDIEDNELADIQDMIVDELGKLRLIGGTVMHDSNDPDPPAYNNQEGYGLFYFSHDRIDGHLGEHLNENNFSSHAKWDVSGDFSDSGGSAIYTESSDAGTLIQVADDRLEEGIANITYAFTYTITGFNTEKITTFEILGQNGVLTVDTISHQGDHTNGTYLGVVLTGGGGSGVEATIVVGSNDVTSVTITHASSGYAVNDTLTIPHATIGGTGAVTCDVATVAGGQFSSSSTKLTKADGTHTTTFTSHATDPDQPFTIDVASNGSLAGELIASDAADNRTFDNDYGNWVPYDDSGTDVVRAMVSNKLRVTTQVDDEKEGAQLPIVHVGDGSTTTVKVGKTYLISMDLAVTTGTPDMIIGLGGALTEPFAISDSETTYVKELTAINSTGALLIYNISSTAIVFTVDEVSVKEKRAFSYVSLKVYDPPETGDDYLAIVNNNTTFTVGGGNTTNTSTTITHTGDLRIKPGMAVAGTNIPADTLVLSITNDTTFEMTAAATGTVSDSSLTFTFTKPPGAIMYSKNRDSWSQSDTIPLGIGATGIKPIFYSVDGALRISDGSFLSPSMWYGYISRVLFKNQEPSIAIEEWYSAEQRLIPPGISYFDKSYTNISGETANTYAIGATGWFGDGNGGGGHSQYVDVARGTIEDHTGWTDDEGPVIRVSNPGYRIQVGTWGVWKSWIRLTATLKIGPYNTNSSAWGPGAKYIATDIERHEHGAGAETFQWAEWNFEPLHCPIDTADGLSWVPGADKDYDVWRTQLSFSTYNGGIGFGHYQILGSTLHEAADTPLPALQDGGNGFAYGYVTGGNIAMLFDWRTKKDSGDDDWAFGNNIGQWEIGATFIYDGNQESTITKLFDEIDGVTDNMNLANAGVSTITVDGRPGVTLVIADPNHNGARRSDGTAFNKRVTGCNIYMKDISIASDASGAGTWWLQYTADFETGKLKVISTQAEHEVSYHEDIARQSYYFWALDATHSKTPSRAISYEDQTGYSKLEEKKVNSYKTAVVTNRTAYIGNINQGPEGKKVTYGDRMLKSSVNKFDKFPESRRIEVSVEDGDEIVKLEEYADRILQFKKHKMHIINVSQEIEFLEETFLHKGIPHPASVCKTDYGIAWVNKHGCYLYDGQQVRNLLERDGRQIISENEWFGFLTPGKDASHLNLTGTHTGANNQATVMTDSAASFVTDALIGGMIHNVDENASGEITDNDGTTVTVAALIGAASSANNEWDAGDKYRIDLNGILMDPMIGYLPHKRQLIVFDDITTNSLDDPRMYLYDMVTQSWVKGSDYVVSLGRIIDYSKTNFINDWNGDLVYAIGSNIIKWTDIAPINAYNKLIVKTKDIDFGQPAQRKKVYRVRISYKGDGNGITLKYSVNGDTDTLYQFLRTLDGTAHNVPLEDKTDTTVWHHADLKVATSSEANNIYSFQLHFSGGINTLPADFEINDISIVYRLKGVK